MVRVHLIVKLGLSEFPFIDDACKGPMAAASYDDGQSCGKVSQAPEAYMLQVVSQRKRIKAALGMQATSAWRLHMLHSVWASWSKEAAAKVSKRDAMHRIILYWSNRALVRAFKAWQAKVKHFHNLDALLASYLGKCATQFQALRPMYTHIYDYYIYVTMLAITKKVANIFQINTIIANTMVTLIGIVPSIKRLGTFKAFRLYVCRYKDHSVAA